MDYYGIHPPSEVNVPGVGSPRHNRSVDRSSSRSRSPSPLSLRDPQEDGDYHLDPDSSASEDEAAAPQPQPQRAARPLPLSLAAASLDLPSLTHRLAHSQSPKVRQQVGNKGYKRSQTLPLDATPPHATPTRSEAPFDEGTMRTPPPTQVSPQVASQDALSLSSQVPYNWVDFEEEPPACLLEEPPSLKTYHRPADVAVTSPYSSPVKAGTLEEDPTMVASPKATLPFEDECDPTLARDPTFLEKETTAEEKKVDVEEKKTDSPRSRSHQYLPPPSPKSPRHNHQLGASHRWSKSAAAPDQTAAPAPTPLEFSPTKPETRSWMEEEEEEVKVLLPATAVAPPPGPHPMQRHRSFEHARGARGSTSPGRSSIVSGTGSAHSSSSMSAAILQRMDVRQQARERIKNRIRGTHSFDHAPQAAPKPVEDLQNLHEPIEMQRSASLEIRRTPSLDLDRSAASLPGFSADEGSPQKSVGHRDFDGEITRRRRRLEMSQAEYMAMKTARDSPEKSIPLDEVPLLGQIPLLSATPASSEAPGRASETTAAGGWPKRESVDAPHGVLATPISPPVPADGIPQLKTPHQSTFSASAIYSGESISTNEPPSLKRRDAEAIPSTPRTSHTEEQPSLSRPLPQPVTPRRSNATPLRSQPKSLRPVAQPSAMSAPSAEDETIDLVESNTHEDAASLTSVDTATLIASLDELVNDLEDMTNQEVVEALRTQDGDSQSDTNAFFKPLMVQSINNDLGIPKGDVMLCLLNETKERTWASRVTESIWRCRSMRQNCDTNWLRQKIERKPGSPSRGRTSVAVDLDDNSVVGGIDTVEETQKSALEHLKYDDFDDALALYENIAGSYYRYFDDLIRVSRHMPHETLLKRVAYFKAFVGACVHSIGIIHMLRGEYSEALFCFTKATASRAECHGVGSTDHLTSFVKKAICQFALDDIVEAAKSYEECLDLAQKSAKSISDQRQIAELLNNLGCLAFLAGRPEKALELFNESFRSQGVALDHSLYAGARFSCHSSTVNMSVTRSNIGFLALLTRDIPKALEAFEYSVNQQQLLLRDAHRTLIASMDHLVVAQVISGNKDKAVRLLRRMYLMQVDAFGPGDQQCTATNDKIAMLQGPSTVASGDNSGEHSYPGEIFAGDREEPKAKSNNPVMKMFKKMSKKK